MKEAAARMWGAVAATPRRLRVSPHPQPEAPIPKLVETR